MNAPAIAPDDLIDGIANSFQRARPARLEVPASARLATIDELFQLLCRAGEAWRHNQGLNFGIWRDGAFPMGDYASLFARAEDRDFQTFIERVCGPDGRREFCWAQYHAQVFAPLLWQRTLTLLTPLFARLGWPAGEVDMDVFVGRYQRTPRGIHTDSAHTLMYVVEGPKTLAFWPDGYFEQQGVHITGSRPQRTLVGVKPEPFLADAVQLTAQSGELIVWPASFWHIGLHDPKNGPTAALNLGLFEPRPKDAILMDVLHEVLDGELTRPWSTPTGDERESMQDMVAHLPREEARGIATLRTLVEQGWLEKLVHTRWLQRVSARGFQHVPAPDPSVPYSGEPAHLRDASMPVLWHRFDDDMVISGHGHFTRTTYDPALVTLLQRLHDGQTVTLDGAGGQSAHAQAELLTLLRTWRAVTWGTRSHPATGDAHE